MSSGPASGGAVALTEESVTHRQGPSAVKAPGAARVAFGPHRSSTNTPSSLVALAAGAATVAAVLAYARRRRRYPLDDKVVLVTGGSRGLGLVLARELVRRGARVALLARDAGEVARAADGLAPGRVLAIVGDVSRPDDGRRAVEEVVQRFGRLDVLVNNAGAILCAPLERTRVEDFQTMMDVHFWGTLHMTRAALPHLRARRGSRVVNICSIGGKIAVPHLGAYCASKFAQAGLSSAMAEELRDEGVVVSTVYPGLMRTGGHVNARFRGDAEREFRLFALAAGLPVASMGAERAARRIVLAIARGEADVVLPYSVRQAARAAALAPNLTTRLFAAVDAWLPRDHGGGASGDAVRGADLPLPRPVEAATILGERAARRNNQRG
jgi:NAD(P)-dependent dehydrogenase (short-subunit alcohol dehydrogenase family)